MRIKKFRSNEYIRAGGVWVRNFTLNKVKPLGISHMYSNDEHHIVISNENQNRVHSNIADEKLEFNRAVIISDGHNFRWKHLLISKLPRDILVLAVHRAAKNWKLMSPELPPEHQRPINALVANNPFPEAMSDMPPMYYPTCVASSRTYYPFLKKYPGNVFVYEPIPEDEFGTEKAEKYFIDDYRNPICAAIGLAYRFGVTDLMLISCDYAFPQEKEFAEELPNGLWSYPQQLQAQEIIDANLHWFANREDEDREIRVADWSDGAKYANATYISSEEEALSFFPEEGTS